MVKKLINRKKFITTTLSGIVGINLINRSLETENSFISVNRNIGTTGISVTPVCFGAPRTNQESLIRYAIDKGMNFIDTGRSYGNGNNERLVDRAIEGKSSTLNSGFADRKEIFDRYPVFIINIRYSVPVCIFH